MKKIKKQAKKLKDFFERRGSFWIKKLGKKSTYKEMLSSIETDPAKLSGMIGAFLADKELLKHLGSITDSASTIYDKALDSEYLKTHIGGGDHRLFDGGHDIFSAWDRVKDALPDDSFQEELVGYISALWKDVSTVKGLPFETVSKESFESWVNAVSGWIPGMDRKYLYDLLSFDAYELLSTGLGVGAVMFALKKEDEEKLAELLGSMGILSILSANPLMGLAVVAVSVFAYKKKKMEFDGVAFAKSGVVATSSIALFGILGLPILFELVIVGVLTALLRKKVLDNETLCRDILEKLKEKGRDLKGVVSRVA